MFKKYGMAKKYYSSISSKDFKHISNEKVESKKNINYFSTNLNLSKEDIKSLSSFEENGFAILNNFISSEEIDIINDAIDKGLQSGKYQFVNKNKIMFAIHLLPELKKIASDKTLLQLLSYLFDGDNAILFQSINFIMGSEQATHSDSIHMTTFPLGGLLGVWIALEDIDEDNGPLHYYAGSHKLPYYMNKDYDNEGNIFMIGNKSYKEYEEMIAKKIKENNLQKINFLAKKGDVLIWHANLFHGGNEHINKNKTRKSVVFHYFKEDAICYHEITQRPSLIKP